MPCKPAWTQQKVLLTSRPPWQNPINSSPKNFLSSIIDTFPNEATSVYANTFIKTNFDFFLLFNKLQWVDITKEGIKLLASSSTTIHFLSWLILYKVGCIKQHKSHLMQNWSTVFWQNTLYVNETFYCIHVYKIKFRLKVF